MKNYYRFVVATMFVLLFAIAVGCAPKQIPIFPKDVETTCIRGAVSYQSPIDSTQVPYPHASVTAWRHDGDQAIAETKTDEAGNYCIEVPLEDYTVDLRVWGLNYLQRTTYICQGSSDNIDLGKTSLKCGDDCKSVDIVTECKERQKGRRSRY